MLYQLMLPLDVSETIHFSMVSTTPGITKLFLVCFACPKFDGRGISVLYGLSFLIIVILDSFSYWLASHFSTCSQLIILITKEQQQSHCTVLGRIHVFPVFKNTHTHTQNRPFPIPSILTPLLNFVNPQRLPGAQLLQPQVLAMPSDIISHSGTNSTRLK